MREEEENEGRKTSFSPAWPTAWFGPGQKKKTTWQEGGERERKKREEESTNRIEVIQPNWSLAIVAPVTYRCTIKSDNKELQSGKNRASVLSHRFLFPFLFFGTLYPAFFLLRGLSNPPPQVNERMSCLKVLTRHKNKHGEHASHLSMKKRERKKGASKKGGEEEYMNKLRSSRGYKCIYSSSGRWEWEKEEHLCCYQVLSSHDAAARKYNLEREIK